MLIEDIRQSLPIDDKGGIGNGEVFIFDMAGFGIWHILKMHIFTLKTFMKYIQVFIVFKYSFFNI